VATTTQASKVYDGTVAANLIDSNYSSTGVVAGDSVIINKPTIGVYDNKNTGVGKLVSVSGLTVTSATESASGVPIYGYNLSSSEASGAIGTITPAPLTISAATDSRIYNGTSSSSGAPAVTSGQVFSGDTLSGLSQVFGSKNVLGANQSTLSVNNSYTLADGNSGNNYAVTLATAPGTINTAPALVTANSGSTVYNGAIQSISGFSASGLVGGETSADLTGVSAGASGRNAGSYTSTASGTAANYNLSFSDGLFTITPAPLTISAATDSRIYNGTSSSSGAPAVTSGQVFSGDTLSGLSQVFGSKHVLGTNQSTLSVNNSYTLVDGNSGNNYVVTLATAPGTITPLDLPVNGLVANNKVYDATLVAPLSGSASVNVIRGDVATLGGTAVGAFADRNVAQLKAVSVSGLSLNGIDASNYNLLALTTLSAAIAPASLAPSFSIKNKPFDGTTIADISGYTLQGGLASDDVAIVGASAEFDNALAGNDKPVTIAGFTLSGQDANNYQLSAPTAKSTASITQQLNGLPPNDEPITDKQVNPFFGTKLSKASSPTGSNFVAIDSKAISPPTSAASAQEVTASGSIQSEQPASATDVSANSASREYEESDQRSAEVAQNILGLSNDPTSAAMSPARLQQLMQSAASLIRRYPVRMLNP